MVFWSWSKSSISWLIHECWMLPVLNWSWSYTDYSSKCLKWHDLQKWMWQKRLNQRFLILNFPLPNWFLILEKNAKSAGIIESCIMNWVFVKVWWTSHAHLAVMALKQSDKSVCCNFLQLFNTLFAVVPSWVRKTKGIKSIRWDTNHK